MVAFAKEKTQVLGQYIGINYERTRNRLAGCINDTRDWCKEHSPYLTSPGEFLHEEAATKAGILRFVKAGLARLRPDDWFILQISGHGSYKPDQSGRESDGRTELFIPYDYDKNVITDNEWYGLLSQRAPGSKVLFITDCCHSGTMARSRRKQAVQPRFIPFDQVAMGMAPEYRERLYSLAPRSEEDGIAEGVVHLSGCRDDEVSYDAVFRGRANGALTYFAIDALHDLQPGATFFDWKMAIGSRLPSRTYSQSPQMNAERAWFSQVMPGFELQPEAPPPATPDEQPPRERLRFGNWEVAGWKRVQE